MGGDKNTRPKLILGAADCAQHGKPPSDILQQALDCADYSSLPREGGIDGQEAGLVSKLRKLANVYTSFDSMMGTKMNQQKWTETYPKMWGIVASVERLRAEMKNV